VSSPGAVSVFSDLERLAGCLKELKS